MHEIFHRHEFSAGSRVIFPAFAAFHQRKQRFLPRIAEVLDGKSAFGEKPTAACRQTFLPERGAVKGVATALRGKML